MMTDETNARLKQKIRRYVNSKDVSDPYIVKAIRRFVHDWKTDPVNIAYVDPPFHDNEHISNRILLRVLEAAENESTNTGKYLEILNTVSRKICKRDWQFLRASLERASGIYTYGSANRILVGEDRIVPVNLEEVPRKTRFHYILTPTRIETVKPDFTYSTHPVPDELRAIHKDLVEALVIPAYRESSNIILCDLFHIDNENEMAKNTDSHERAEELVEFVENVFVRNSGVFIDEETVERLA